MSKKALREERSKTAQFRFYAIGGDTGDKYPFAVGDACRAAGEIVIGRFKEERYRDMFLEFVRADYVNDEPKPATESTDASISDGK